MRRAAAALVAFAALLALEAHAQDEAPQAAELDKQAVQLAEEGKYSEAQPLLERSLELRLKKLGPDHPGVAESLNLLGELHMAQGRFEDAERAHRRALEIREKALGPGHEQVGDSLNNLASVYIEQGRYAEAEPLHQRSLAISEKLHGPDHPDVATSLNNLGQVYTELGRHDEARRLYQRSLAIREKALPPDDPSTANVLNNLAYLNQVQGRYAEAEALYKRALSMRERSLGPEDRAVAAALNNLGAVYQEEGRVREAEPLYARSLEIREKALGPDHPEVAVTLNNLAQLRQSLGRHEEAAGLYRRGLAIWEKANGGEHPDTASFLNNLGTVYRDMGRHADAEPVLARALEIREKAFGAEHSTTAISLANLGSLYRAQQRYDAALPLYERALAIRESTLGPEHPDVARSLNNLADLRQAQHLDAEALGYARRASAIYRQRILEATDENSVREAATNRAGFFRHLALLESSPRSSETIDESFAIAQLAQATGTGAAVARMTVRFSQGDGELASLVRRKQDLVERLRRGDDELAKAASEPAARRDRAAEQRLREDLATAHRLLAGTEADLQARFPRYQVLTRPEPLPLAKVQALLNRDEALVLYAVAPESSWVWVVRPGRASFTKLPADEAALTKAVTRARTRLMPDAVGVMRLDVRALNELEQHIFAPVMRELSGVKHVLLVPSGPLQSLPFGMLVASPPRTLARPIDYRNVDWLVKRFAFSVLPSVGSLRGLREFARPSTGDRPFAGFGDPLLNESNRLPETAKELRSMARILKAGEGSLWLGDAATETAVKSLDLARYRVVAFATHALMAGELRGLLEPALVLTPPAKATAQDDGFLSAAEIAQLRLNADWVLLSACNTAAADGTPGAEGLSGLGKSFFYAGSRSLLVSHWPVASEATVLLTTKMLAEYTAKPMRGRAEALRRAMLSVMSTPGHPEYAQPFYWAPFILVGEGADKPPVGGLRVISSNGRGR